MPPEQRRKAFFQAAPIAALSAILLIGSIYADSWLMRVTGILMIVAAFAVLGRGGLD